MKYFLHFYLGITSFFGGLGIFQTLDSWFHGEAMAATSGGAEVHELYRGARATAMGGAFTALADDEQAIFYNAAGLAGISKAQLHVPIMLEASTGAFSSSATSSLSGLGPSTINALMGKNIYARGQASPSLIFQNIGVAFIVDGQAAIFARNKALPWITIGYQNTNGVQAAAGFSVFGKRRRAKNDLRVGLAAKMLYRRGGYHRLNLSEVINANKNTISDITGPYGIGYGGDLSTQYVHEMNKQWKWGAGMSWNDIGDTSFASTQADPLKSNLSAGFYFKYEANPFLSTTLVYDYRQILKAMDIKKKSHLGLELGLPVVKVYAGLNQLFLTYGASVDFSLIKITALSYAEELAEVAGMDPDRRYMLSIDIKFGI